MMSQVLSSSSPSTEARMLMGTLARGLHRCGLPDSELEPLLMELGQSIGVEVEILSTPTLLVLTWGENSRLAPMMLRLDPGALDLFAREAWMDLVAKLRTGKLSPDQAIAQAKILQNTPARYDTSLLLAGHALAASAASVLFGGNLPEAIVSLGLGLVVGLGYKMFSQGRPSLWIEALIAALITILSMVCASVFGGMEPGRLVLSGLVALLPGFSFTVALQELSAQHLVSGSTRLASSMMTLMALGCGVALGAEVATKMGLETSYGGGTLPSTIHVLAFIIASGAFVLLLQLRAERLWSVLVTSALSTGTAMLATEHFGQIPGAFIGALVLGVSSHLIAQQKDHPAASLLVPGLWLLVPGSVGFRGVQAWLSGHTLAGIQGLFSMAMAAAALGAGLWAAGWVTTQITGQLAKWQT